MGKASQSIAWNNNKQGILLSCSSRTLSLPNFFPNLLFHFFREIEVFDRDQNITIFLMHNLAGYCSIWKLMLGSFPSTLAGSGSPKVQSVLQSSLNNNWWSSSSTIFFIRKTLGEPVRVEGKLPSINFQIARNLPNY